jgi:quercetin dioxygenase-like cupin family protein
MIIFAKDRLKTIRPGAQGGVGEVHGLHSLTADRRPDKSHFKMVGRMTLAPGSSIGLHTHKDDEEIYIILSGQGLYTKNDGQTETVGPGDMTLTRRGHQHGLANDGAETLIFIAVIAAD